MMSQARSPQIERALPHNHDAERMVLGALLLGGGEMYAETAAALPIAPQAKPEETFFFPAHRAIFRAMGRVMASGRMLEPMALQDEMRAAGELEFIGGAAYIASLWDNAWRMPSLDNWVGLIKAAALRREVIAQAASLQEVAWDISEPIESVVEQAQRIGYDLEMPGCGDTWESIAEMAPARLDQIVQVADAGKMLVGTATGFHDLDYLTGGYEAGDLIYVAGRPAMGKTAFALGCALNAARNEHNEGKTVAVFEMEMSKAQLMNRWYGQEAKVDVRRIRLGMMEKNEWRRMDQAREGFQAISNLLVDDRPGLSPVQIRAKLRRIRKPLSLVVIDYLSLMRLPGATRAEESSEKIRCEALSRELKAIAKEFSTPVMTILPLNKVEGSNIKAPTLNDVSYVGGYEPDIVLMLHREEYYNPATEKQNLAELIIGKNRNGPTGKVELVFLKQTASFENKYRGDL